MTFDQNIAGIAKMNCSCSRPLKWAYAPCCRSGARWGVLKPCNSSFPWKMKKKMYFCSPWGEAGGYAVGEVLLLSSCFSQFFWVFSNCLQWLWWVGNNWLVGVSPASAACRSPWLPEPMAAGARGCLSGLAFTWVPIWCSWPAQPSSS